MNHKFTEEQFLDAIRTSTTHAEAGRKLGTKSNISINCLKHRSTYSTYFNSLTPDTSHFKLFSRRFADPTYSMFQCQYNWESKRSSLRGHEFKLNLKQFEEFLKGKCFYCGCSGKSKLKGHPKIRVNGIDRIDNNIGYMINNCVSCCHDCNIMKHNKEFDYWLLKVKQIYENLDLSDRALKLEREN